MRVTTARAGNPCWAHAKRVLVTGVIHAKAGNRVTLQRLDPFTTVSA